MDKTIKRSAETRAIVLKTARITGVSVSMVEKVIKGDRSNELVLSTYMELLETGIEKENELKEAVKKLVPFPTSNRKNYKQKAI